MKKNIVILGAPRSGKSTLGYMLSEKYPYEIIRGDNILNVERHMLTTREEKEPGVFIETMPLEVNAREILRAMYGQLSIDTRIIGRNIIVETSELDLKDAVEIFGKECEIYCLGMPEITREELIEAIQKNDGPGEWSNSTRFRVLQDPICDGIIAQSKRLREEAKKYPEVKFWDTSGDRARVLQEIIEDIEENIWLKQEC